MDQASALHASGRLIDAERIYRKILDADPAPQPQLLYLLGLVSLQLGRATDAWSFGRRSLEAQPGNAAALALLGFAATAMGRLERAIDCFDQSLHIQPDLVAALHARGDAQRQLGKFRDAAASYDRALLAGGVSIPLLLERAEVMLLSGQAQVALADFERILAHEKDNGRAQFGRAASLRAVGRRVEAIQAYELIVARQPHDLGALHNLGTVQMELERHEAAILTFDRVLALDPPKEALVKALHNRANALHGLGRNADAMEWYDRALDVNDRSTETQVAKGVALADLGRHEDALACYAQALRLDPSSSFALISRGNSLLKLARHEEALASFEQALLAAPHNADALSGCGVALRHLWRLDPALKSLEAAVAAAPSHAIALNNCGLVARDLRRYTEAIGYFERAIAAKPAFVGAMANLADLFQDLKRYDDAVRVLERVVIADPDFENVLGYLFRAKANLCDWADYESQRQVLIEAVRSGKRAADPLTFLAVTDEAAGQLQCARASIPVYATQLSRLWARERYRHERIRIAYVSADYRDHPVSQLLIGILEGHDRSRFETFGVSLRRDPRQGSMRCRIERACDGFWECCDDSDASVAAQLRAAEIDIVVDLTGHTAGRRYGILARRPAPVHVNFLGYTGTMGADHIDYIIADSLAIPEEMERHYSERIVRLPGTYLPNDDKQPIDECTPSRAELGLPEHAFVFCAFNNPIKFAPDRFQAWMRILLETDDSCLWLRDGPAAMMSNLCAQARHAGVSPDRLVFASSTKETARHLARYRCADLFLDTFPYNAHATARDALWAGLPVLTSMGQAFASRVAGSLLSALGLPDLIAADTDQYVSTAVRLVREPRLLAALRDRLRHAIRGGGAFDTGLYVGHLESAFKAMTERTESALSPAGTAAFLS